MPRLELNCTSHLLIPLPLPPLYFQVDTKAYPRHGTPSTHSADIGRSRAAGNPSSARKHQHLDSAALGRAVAALLGQARAGAGMLEGEAEAGGEDDSAAAAWKWCDVVIVHGCEALDVDLLPPRRVGLGPTEAILVFVDTVPQV